MRFVDVNILIYAHRRGSPDHDRYREWLEAARSDVEPLGVCDLVMNGFVRIVTNPKAFKEPTSTSDALRFVDQLRTSPSFLRSEPSSAVWDRFANLASSIGARGNAIADTYLAAAAMDLNATLVTADKRFARFEGLRWAHPLN